MNTGCAGCRRVGRTNTCVFFLCVLQNSSVLSVPSPTGKYNTFFHIFVYFAISLRFFRFYHFSNLSPSLSMWYDGHVCAVSAVSGAINTELHFQLCLYRVTMWRVVSVRRFTSGEKLWVFMTSHRSFHRRHPAHRVLVVILQSFIYSSSCDDKTMTQRHYFAMQEAA